MRDIIERLRAKKKRLILNVPSFKRYVFKKVKAALDDETVPILFGLRRVGKTTILVQLLKENDDSIYITFRDSYISSLSRYQLGELVELLVSSGIKSIYFDEVQLMSDWSDFIIEIFDSFPGLKMVVTGSSSLSLALRETGLDRTRKIYIQTLSFGEYLSFWKASPTKENFEFFLGFSGFPKYAFTKTRQNSFDLQRSEILDEVLNNDIPLNDKSVVPNLLVKLVYSLANLTNGEVNVSSLVGKVAPNFRERDALSYIDLLVKSNLLQKVQRINSDLSFPKRQKFKIYLNPHLHLWILNSSFSDLPSEYKGQIVESYLLHWFLSLNDSGKVFYYLKDTKNNQEVDFVSLNALASMTRVKTMHEVKYSQRKDFDLSFMKSLPSTNKIVWNLTGSDIDGVGAKNLLQTDDKAL